MMPFWGVGWGRGEGNCQHRGAEYRSCIKTSIKKPENAGAWTTMGKQERLLIALEYSGYGVGGENVTVL